MKKCVLLLILALLLSACGGDVRTVERQIGESELYSAAEIDDAMDVVVRNFRKEFDGCTLLNIVYSEELNNERADAWAKQYQAKEAIVLVSSFETGAAGGDGSLNPNDTYTGYQWILTRSGGSWTLQTWGYG